MEEEINGILIREVEQKNIMTKSSLPVGGHSVPIPMWAVHMPASIAMLLLWKRFADTPLQRNGALSLM